MADLGLISDTPYDPPSTTFVDADQRAKMKWEPRM